MRRLLAAALAGLVWVSVGWLPAQAAAPITSQSYVKETGLDALKAKGLDGAGVTIAVLDGPPDLSVPELQGADVTVSELCQFTPLPYSVAHGTAVLSLLASPAFGWAPKAKYLFYTTWGGIPQGASDGPQTCPTGISRSLASRINQAITDGAQIITSSVVTLTDVDDELAFALARAMAKGVAVTIAVGNDHSDIIGSAAHNGVIGVGANDATGARASFSNFGPGLSVMAPGAGIAIRAMDADQKLTVINPKGQGTSLAAPMVAGALALAKQAFPKATGNQLVQSLIKTAQRSGTAWDPYVGWGSFAPSLLTTQDPTGLPDVNPLANKIPAASPTTQEYADYVDGLVHPAAITNDPDYVYRGNDKEIAAQYPNSKPGTSPRYKTASPAVSGSASSSGVPVGGSGSTPLLIAGGVVAVALLAGLGVVLLMRRRKVTAPVVPSGHPGPGVPPVGYPSGQQPYPGQPSYPSPQQYPAQHPYPGQPPVAQQSYPAQQPYPGQPPQQPGPYGYPQPPSGQPPQPPA
ncbi:MAG: S8 family serine peptidase [Micropruina sp.]|nr:S8 family serine peptidase [Micropruina sp.]